MSEEKIKTIFNEGYKALSNEDYPKAEEIFNALLSDDMNSDVLVFYLASTYMKKGNHALSIILFQEAIRRRPDFLEAINNLGYVYKQEQMIDESREQFEKALAIVNAPNCQLSNKDKADYVTNLGTTYIANGTPQKALEILNEAAKLDPDNGQVKWNRSLAYLELGDYENGFNEYDFGERTERTKDRKYADIGTPFWDGTPGKTIAIYGEQGIGDELMFASMIDDVTKDCRVILDTHPRLQKMFQQNFPHIPVYGTRKVGELAWSKYHHVDAKISIGSLGKFYRKKPEDFPGTPYLEADPVLIEKYKHKLAEIGPRKKIGISWRGGTVKTNKGTRKIKMDLLLPLFDCDVDFISLQYDKNIHDSVKQFEDRFNVKLNHWQDVLDDYDETAGLVSNLDYIISVPQSVVHLAGALGVKTLQLCPKKALWQMGVYGQNMPWYSCVENVWQEMEGDWLPVIETAKEKLCSLLQNNTSN